LSDAGAFVLRRAILGSEELIHLRSAVMHTIREIDFRGACERVQSLRPMILPAADPHDDARPLTDASTLILYAEKESAVLAESSPTRAGLERTPRRWFPRGECRLVTRRGPGGPVQQASLIFHCADYHASMAEFYHRLKSGKVRQAA
jgi:hypothetical protein